MVREFTRLFEAKNKTTSCRELLGVDLINGDWQAAAERVKSICPKVVQDAAEILESLVFTNANRDCPSLWIVL